MNLLSNPKVTLLLFVALLGLGIAYVVRTNKPATELAVTAGAKSGGGAATNTAPAAKTTNAPGAAAQAERSATNATAAKIDGGNTNLLAGGTNLVAGATNLPAGSTNLAAGATNLPVGAKPPAKGDQDKLASTDEIQLSFQGANIDMIVQWLAKTTGKSVVKHPRAQCQLTIVNSKKLTMREAVNLVYRALALEGFTTVESSTSIFIVPEGQEPKMTPELMDAAKGAVPEGRQRLVKFFPLKHIQPADLKDKVRGVLSEKGTIEVDDRANQVIVTDYNDNVRLIGELVGELDVVSVFDSVIEIYTLKYLEAEELANLLGLILNVQSSGGAKSSPPSGGGPSMDGPPMMGGPPGGRPSAPSPSASASGGASGNPQQVRFWPDKSSSRLIMATPKARLTEVRELIKLLDTEKPQDMSVRVIPLKNVNAEDLVKELAPLYQKLGGQAKDNIQVTANDRSNSLIILSTEVNFKAIQKLVASLDTEEAQEKIMQAFPLKNADAEDVAKQLQELNTTQEDSGFSRYFYYGGGSQSKNTKKMSVVADRRRNTVIVQAPPGAMERIGKMIAKLDEPVTDNSLAPKIFPLKFVSASDLEDVLNELFLKKTQNRSYYYFFDDYPQDTADRNVGRLYGKVRITSEPYSNSLIVTANSTENLAAVEEVIKKLDAPSEAGETTMRVSLRFAKASTLANGLNILFAKNGSPPLRVTQPQNPNIPQPQQPNRTTDDSQTKFDLEEESKEEGYFPWLGGQADNSFRGSDSRNTTRPVSDLVGRVRVVADQRGNALLITANVHFFPQVMKLIEEMDAPTDQVLIEARLLEVSSDFLDKLGVRWSPNGSQVFTPDDYDNSLLGHVNGRHQQGFGGTTVANTPGLGTAAQALTSLRSGILDSTISMDFLVQFLRKTTDASVLAQPQINIRDNETGRLFVGQRVPVPDNTQVSQLGGQNTTFRYQPVGVQLEVTPHINNTGDVELKIHAESSTVVPGQLVLGGSVFDTRNFRTDLTAKNGQTLVLGGIIQKQVSDTLRKVPILGSIPGLGWAFKKKDKTTHEVELMVFLRPKVVHTEKDAKDLLDEVEKKAPLIKQWEQNAQTDKKLKTEKKAKGK